jgi:integrase
MASVHQHRNRWRVKWRDEHGRQLVESYATKAEAEKAARKVEAHTVVDGKAPTTLDPDALTVARWWDRWEPGRPWRASSRATHAVHWRRYIKPVFGGIPLEKVTTADVERWHRKLEARGLAPRTVAAIHRTFSMCLQAAVKDALIPRNPARDARLRRPAHAPPVALDTATVARLLDAIAATSPTLAGYARFVAATGLRRAEAAGITWDRLDLDAGVVTVDRQLDHTAARQPAWSPTKTAKARRVVLPASIVEELRARRGIGAALVFTDARGNPWPRTTLADAWHRAADYLEKNGAPLPEGARGWHTLRHTVASRLLEAGVPPVEAAQLLGHEPAMLLNVYGHITDRSAADARLRAALDH